MIGEDGRMTEAAGERFAGMTVLAAREAVVAALREQGAIARTEPYVHAVPHSHRSGERIEPLVSLQWFMEMEQLARPAIDAVLDGRLRVHPESQRKRYLDWLENIRPWCISRQLWWGHQIPVWYRGEETYVGTTAPEGDGWTRDEDVLDTWFSSGLWPFATLGWPDDTPGAARLLSDRRALDRARHPLPLGRAHGDARDRVHRRAAVLRRLQPRDDPGPRRPPDVEVARQRRRSARADRPARRRRDALRAAGDVLDAGRALLGREDRAGPPAGEQALQRLAARAAAAAGGRRASGERRAAAGGRGRWILSRLQRAKAGTARAIEAFEFHRAALGLYDFVYGELCDWYLEIVKPRLYADDNEDVARFALGVLAETLAIAHPVIPFVTEELWSHIPGADGAADGAPVAGGRRVADRHAGRGGGRARDRRGAGAARLARRDRRRARAPCCRRGSRPTATSAPREHVARLARCEWSPDGGEPAATVAVPGGVIAVLATDALDLGAAARRIEERRALAGRRDRPCGAAARQRGLRRQGAGGGRAGRARQARRPARGARRAVSTPGAPRRPRSTCSAWSCSACASASSACAGC